MMTRGLGCDAGTFCDNRYIVLPPKTRALEQEYLVLANCPTRIDCSTVCGEMFSCLRILSTNPYPFSR